MLTFFYSININTENLFTELLSLSFVCRNKTLVPNTFINIIYFIYSIIRIIIWNCKTIEINITEVISSESNWSSLYIHIIYIKEFLNCSILSSLKPNLQILLMENNFESIPNIWLEIETNWIKHLSNSFCFFDKWNLFLIRSIQFNGIVVLFIIKSGYYDSMP